MFNTLDKQSGLVIVNKLVLFILLIDHIDFFPCKNQFVPIRYRISANPYDIGLITDARKSVTCLVNILIYLLDDGLYLFENNDVFNRKSEYRTKKGKGKYRFNYVF